ncbi:hypothetical protein F8388_005954 [Cannabis sativa]|uniref:Uncharacterized protein n=1 Tax=Cannabis sativa TaxID=3483 RepID=A0A7J6IBP0_CANSA|nr:hypothetical protein F8388_005954 [Cannabis sativa]KAF4404605.1 hypothetical protein G4B88_005991 [Cannabis sativa]
MGKLSLAYVWYCYYLNWVVQAYQDDIELPKADVVSQKHGCKKVSKKDTNVLPSASDDDFETEKIVAKPVSTKKRKAVSDDASASKKRKSKNVGEHSNLDKVCEPRVADDPKVVNVAKKGKKKPVSKSLGKKKSEAPSVDIPLVDRCSALSLRMRFLQAQL